ncbi:MAG: uroporphyrinogen-III C-methyltransferase [Gallionellaceae bacterium]|nr:uroporphyrinogen-III C-methyltransferase [Gallionellaceae bacterium]
MAETTPPETPVQTPAPNPARHGWILPLALILAVLAFATTGGVFWYMQMRMQDLEVQLARRIGQFDTSSQEARAAAKEARASIENVVVRIGALEAKALEAQNQQLALEAVYQDLARSQDERMLADIEQPLLLADQQLQMAGNVRAALLGLDAAEARLVRMKKPQFERLREAIARDSARLKLMPAADVQGINAHIDALLLNVDQLKLDMEPEAVAKPLPKPEVDPVDWMGRLGRETWTEIKQLVRIRRLDNPNVELLAPTQVYFLRENLKLRLLSARLAVLQRDEATFRADIAAAQAWVERYFRRSDALSVAMVKDLKAMAGMPVALQNADLRESLKVLRSLTHGDR